MSAAESKRQRLERAGKLLSSRVRLPMVSGKASAAALLGCFALTATLIPVTLHMPVWIDVEFILLGWWFLWAGALPYLLYQGLRVSDDHQLPPPRNWFSAFEGHTSHGGSS